MSYIKENLMPNEKILFTARVHPAVFLQSIVLFVMTIFVFIYGLSNAAMVSKAGFRAGLRHLVNRKDRRDLSVFQIGLRFIQGRLTNALSITSQLCAYL